MAGGMRAGAGLRWERKVPRLEGGDDEDDEGRHERAGGGVETREMPNHLAVPLKKGFPAHIRPAVRDFLLQHAEDHPDRFKRDIADWDTLRAPCIRPDVRSDAAADALLRSVPRLARARCHSPPPGTTPTSSLSSRSSPRMSVPPPLPDLRSSVP